MNRKFVAAACLSLILASCSYAGYERNYGLGSGPGPIGPEAVYGPMYYDPAPKPVTQDEAFAMANNYLASLRNPNLGLGRPVDHGDSYHIPVVSLDGSLVDIFVVDKFSGWIKSIYR